MYSDTFYLSNNHYINFNRYMVKIDQLHIHAKITGINVGE